ncbi:Ubiquitin-protein ligase [Ciborinia camelliae]|nr:Ubiquitin-protein ligase [Ciborinia camelliae]
MSTSVRVGNVVRRLGGLGNTNRSNEGRVSIDSAARYAPEALEPAEAHDPAASPALEAAASSTPDRSVDPDAYESQRLRDQRATRVDSLLDGNPVEQLEQELSASENAQDLAIYVEINELFSFLNLSRNEAWHFRKAAIEELLLPIDKPWEEIHECFCCGPFAMTTATGDCHAPAKIPRCSHVFGRSCIARWLQENDTCPICRAKVVLRLFEMYS